MKEYIVRVYEDRTEWRNKEGEYHREGGPAVEYSNDDKHWYLNGKRHREDGPAVEHSNGDKSWWLNGKRHREDGPAIEFSDGGEEWYLNGEEYTEEEFKKKTESCDGRVVEIDGKKYKLVGV